MKKLILLLFITLFFTACEEPGKTENIHTSLQIEKEDILIVNYDELFIELKDKDISRTERSFSNINTSYYIFRLWVDSYIGITPYFHLECGAQGYMDYYRKAGNLVNDSNFTEGALVVISKEELDKNSCIQNEGQLDDLLGEVNIYVEYTRNRTVPVKHTVTSNTITYTAQEINEAFALFNE